jgi:hypothetical protein
VPYTWITSLEEQFDPAERLNPNTVKPWAFGDVRDDGMIFLAYRRKSRINQDGTYQMNFMKPEAWERRAERAKTRMKELYKRNREITDNYKMERGCRCCGWKDFPEGLDFDHEDPKEKYRDIAQMGTARLELLLAEMAKCIILCACCHRLKTARPEEFKKRMAQYQEALLQAAEDGAF